jgi:hypothetical protein
MGSIFSPPLAMNFCHVSLHVGWYIVSKGFNIQR